MSDAQPPAPARPTFSCCCVGWTGLRASAPSLPRSLAEKKRTSLPPPLPLPSQYGGQTRLYIALPPSLPLPVSLSPRCGGAADGGLSLFAKSTCNFRMFSRRPPSSSFFPFFVCFALAAFLPPKEIQWPAAAGAPLPLARSLLSPPCLLFCAASLCKRYSRKIAGRPYKVCRRLLLASGARIHGALISYKPLAQVMLTLYAPTRLDAGSMQEEEHLICFSALFPFSSLLPLFHTELI